jgi:hypothetical protein
VTELREFVGETLLLLLKNAGVKAKVKVGVLACLVSVRAAGACGHELSAAARQAIASDQCPLTQLTPCRVTPCRAVYTHRATTTRSTAPRTAACA